jgi:hypothetical protein
MWAPYSWYSCFRVISPSYIYYQEPYFHSFPSLESATYLRLSLLARVHEPPPPCLFDLL